MITKTEAPIGGCLDERKTVVYDANFLDNYNSSLRSLLELPPELIVFGPTYETETSRGFPIRFDTYVKRYPKSSMVIFMGFDADDVAIAYRHTGFGNNDSNICAHGYVGTALRGDGIGSVVELVHQDMLCRIAQRMKKKVVYQTINANNNALTDSISRYRSFILRGGIPYGDEGIRMQKEIEMRTQEQRRWQAIFGPYGKFGYKSYVIDGCVTHKIFPPYNVLSDSVPIEQINTIRLERVISTSLDGRVLYCPRVSDMWLGDRDENRAYKYGRLRSLPFLSDNHG